MLNQYLFIHRVTDTSWPVSSPSIKQWMATHHSKLNSPPVPPPAVLSITHTTTPPVPHLSVLSRQPHSQVPHPAVLSPGHPHPRSLSSVIIHITTPLVPHPSVILLRQPLPWSFTQQCYPCNHTLVPHPAVLSPR